MKSRRFSLIFCLAGLFLARQVQASTDFDTSYEVEYQVAESGQTHVTQNITLTNKTSEIYAKQYSLLLESGQVKDIQASDQAGPLTVETQKGNQETSITLFFNEKVAGKGETLNFKLEYDILGLAQKTGQIWEVNLPKLAGVEAIQNYQLKLVVPQVFGEPAFISPDPLKQEATAGNYLLFFDKESLANAGVKAAFGEFQVFNFILNYHLQNDHLSPGTMEIALPPDTAFQQVFYDSISPQPEKIRIDLDGNWLAQYSLKGEERLNITASGHAKVFSQPTAHQAFPSQKEDCLEADTFWPVNDPLIKKKVQSLKTARAVYQLVVAALDYNYERVNQNPQRLGAKQALAQPDQAICTEFTDLFITLARAAGIPAREINGYAHTTDPRLKPLGLITDVLHAWPEYWDEAKQLWTPVDPTWEKTTGGLDYFSEFDLFHFVFAIHGQDSQEPRPAGAYKTQADLTKDIQVAFGEYEIPEKAQLEVSFELDDKVFSETGSQGKIIVRNPGPSAVYNQPLMIKTNGVIFEADRELVVKALPPLAQEEFTFKLKSQPLSLGEAKLTVFLDGQSYRQPIRYRSLLIERILPVIGLVSLTLTFIFLRVRNRRRS